MSSFQEQTLLAQRRATATLILMDGYPISLIRQPAFVDDGAGGKKRQGFPTLLPPVQRFFGIPSNRYDRRGDTEEVTPQGEKVTYEGVLVGLHTDDIQEDDEFDFRGKRWKVQVVDMQTRDYECRAGVNHVA